MLKQLYGEYISYVNTGKKTKGVYFGESIFRLKSFFYFPNIFNLSKNDIEIPEKLISIFKDRPDLIQKYFDDPTFNYDSAKQLIHEYNTTTDSPSNVESNTIVNELKEEIPSLSDDEILSFSNEERIQHVIDLCIDKAKAYNIYKNKTGHMATRIGGYLFVSKYLNETELESRKEIWERLTCSKIGDKTYLYSPYTQKNKYKITIIRHLKELADFFNNIGALDIAEIIEKDIIRLQKK